VKRRRRVCRPLGGMSPLSDRASRNIETWLGRASIIYAKATSALKIFLAGYPESESMACKYSKRWNLGDPCGANKMLNDKIKKDNFKTSLTLREEVRSTHSSEEIE
jgi:hypothetical protein